MNLQNKQIQLAKNTDSLLIISFIHMGKVRLRIRSRDQTKIKSLNL